ncbi:Zinc-carboxypeptidase precursor [Giardia duodenalis]|uniref:Zinc-carboxypeptidase n=1 Tax=Giardia intestinalis TaxID=5741 RepID=V6TG41_GIAIN|nr:Zinc-carboxypeptidase precursor [Giardia intestinalis]
MSPCSIAANHASSCCADIFQIENQKSNPTANKGIDGYESIYNVELVS